MKKFLSFLALMAIATFAHAYVWNIYWTIFDALSPEDIDGDNSPALLDDYSVTWSLVYGDSVAVGSDGKLVEGTYTLLGQMDSTSASGLTWTDVTGRTGAYDDTLFCTQGGVFYGSVSNQTPQTVYQHIYISGATNYYWLSEGKSVTPELSEGRDTPMPSPVDWTKDVEIGPEGGTGAYQTDKWNAVPEPATMSLLGLGALAMVIRRKIRK